MYDSLDHEHWFVFDGHRVFYRRAGAGDPIVFLPNASLTGRLWEYQVAHFRVSHQVIAVDLPGYGRSDRFDAGTTLELYIRWLERFVADLELAPVVLVGNCIGSLSALRYAARRPQAVSALVLLNTLTAEVNRAGFAQAGLARLLDVPNSRLQAPLARWYLRHMPRWHQERFLYVRGQFGPVGDATGQAYLEHTRRCFADPTTRLAYFDLGRDQANWVLTGWPAAHRSAGSGARRTGCCRWRRAGASSRSSSPRRSTSSRAAGTRRPGSHPSRSTRSSRGSLPATAPLGTVIKLDLGASLSGLER